MEVIVMKVQRNDLHQSGPGAAQRRGAFEKKNRQPYRIEKKPLVANRIRQIEGSFAFVEHRFLRQGFWGALDQHQLLLYLFLVIVADRNGLSYYSYDKICSLLRITLDEYILARNTLMEQDLIAFDGYLFQVLSLPAQRVAKVVPDLKDPRQRRQHDPATIRQIIRHSPLAKRHG